MRYIKGFKLFEASNNPENQELIDWIFNQIQRKWNQAAKTKYTTAYLSTLSDADLQDLKNQLNG